MKQITIITGDLKNAEFKDCSEAFKKKYEYRLTYSFNELINKYLKSSFLEELDNIAADDQIMITDIPSWQLAKIYRIILNLQHEYFTLIVLYNEHELINKYN
jgi:hypothetical protein